MKYNQFLVYCCELAPGNVSLTGDWAQGDDSKHDLHYSIILLYNIMIIIAIIIMIIIIIIISNSSISRSSTRSR